MSKKKKDCCCCDNICCCENNCCCDNNCGYGMNGLSVNSCFAPFIFWLIACGAGLINNKSILIILLFLLWGSSDGCGDGCGCGC